MAVFKCPDCAGKVSRQATTCPHCGRPVSESDRQPKKRMSSCGGCLAVIVLSVIVIAYISDRGSPPSSKPEQTPVRHPARVAPKRPKPKPKPSAPAPVPAPAAAEKPDEGKGVFVGIRGTSLYHRPGCVFVQHRDTLMEWGSQAEAVAAGRTYCKRCIKNPAPVALEKERELAARRTAARKGREIEKAKEKERQEAERQREVYNFVVNYGKKGYTLGNQIDLLVGLLRGQGDKCEVVNGCAREIGNNVFDVGCTVVVNNRERYESRWRADMTAKSVVPVSEYAKKLYYASADYGATKVPKPKKPKKPRKRKKRRIPIGPMRR